MNDVPPMDRTPFGADFCVKLFFTLSGFLMTIVIASASWKFFEGPVNDLTRFFPV